jgi:hypothetical protein
MRQIKYTVMQVFSFIEIFRKERDSFAAKKIKSMNGTNLTVNKKRRPLTSTSFQPTDLPVGSLSIN